MLADSELATDILLTPSGLLQAEGLGKLWSELDSLVRAEIGRHPEGAAAWLRECHPLWRLVGRVTFHLMIVPPSARQPWAWRRNALGVLPRRHPREP